jgi:hypothetical protein
MKLRSLTLLFIAFVFAGTALGQDQPVPDYVTKQDFPDSVKTLPLAKLDGTVKKLFMTLLLQQSAYFYRL